MTKRRQNLTFLPLLALFCLSSFLVASTANNGAGNPPGLRADVADSLALVALYKATSHSHRPWTYNTNWLEGPLFAWHGITVENGRVTHIKLSNNNLAFDIPDDILNLTALEELHLDGNHLQKLPDLSPLGAQALRVVKVDSNSLAFGSLEPNLGQAYSFTYLPQDSLLTMPFLPQRAYEDQPFSLSANSGGQSTQYQWFITTFENNRRIRTPVPGATNEIYYVEKASQANTQPVLDVEVTNPAVPGVMLRGRKYLTFVPKNMLQWLDIGEYHHAYSPNGARRDLIVNTEGMDYPAIERHAGHFRSKEFWIGVQNWTDPEGNEYPYYVGRVGGQAGHLIPVSEQTAPVLSQLIGRYEDTVVEVNGRESFDNDAVLDGIDPSLPADRMLHTINNMSMGITVDRKVYAFTNEFHDNYHIIDYNYCNTGNTDGDLDIELPDQTLHDVIFFRSHAWRGHEQASWAAISGQAWGRFSVYDVVGDGHAEYPVDFTAQYGWAGWAFGNYAEPTMGMHENFGGPLISDRHEMVAAGDSVGRLAGATMMGRAVLHADRSTTDTSYDRAQPSIMSWLNNDVRMHRDGLPHESYYRFGIVGPRLGFEDANCIPCRRTSPHFADVNAGGKPFWEIAFDINGAIDGGHAATTGYGPYEMGPGECINVTVAEGINGLSFDAATKIGRAYKWGGVNKNIQNIDYDADGDGVIDTTPNNYDQVFVGTESQTKNQWVLSARDSLFQTFYRARDVFTSSNKFSSYPIAEPPRAPIKFTVQSSPPDAIALSWTPAGQGPAIENWEIFRTEGREDNRYVTGCLEDPSIPCGYERVASLPASATSYMDRDVEPDTDYYYYIQAVGTPQPDAVNTINGTPGGIPLRSGRYLTQTYLPVATSQAAAPTPVPNEVNLIGNYPNPFNTSTQFRYLLQTAEDVRFVVYDILGREVQTLVNERQTPGLHTVDFDAGWLSSGVYIYVFQAGINRKEGTMLLVR